MYSKKAVYFNYKSFAAILLLLLFPATIIFASGSMSVATLSLYPMLGGIVLALIIAFPGLTRLYAINANIDIRQDKVSSALKKARISCKLPFSPVSVHIFAAYVYLLNGMYDDAADKLKEIKEREMTFPEKSKYEATKALIAWVVSGNPERGLEELSVVNRRGADESVYYAAGRLMNICKEPATARKFNEEAMEFHPGNRDIMENLVISYCRTGQDEEAKLLFRNLYYDMKATSDSFYYMAGIKLKKDKKKDAVDFLNAALEMEDKATNMISRRELEDKLNEIKGMIV